MTLEERTLEEQIPETPAEEIIAEDPEIALEPAEELPAEEPAAVEIPAEESPAEESVVPAAPVAQPDAAVAEAPKKKKKRKKPPIALRMLLQFLSFVLSIVLFATLIAGVLVADLRQLTSAGGIKKLVNALLVPTASAPASVKPAPVEADRMHMNLDEEPVPSIPGGLEVDEDGNISIGGDSSINLGDIPEDILTGGGGEANVMNLVDWIYDTIDESNENPMQYSKEEMREFIQESTVADYVSEKLAGFAEDIINGTENTKITADELVDLLKENESLMEEKLNMKLSKDQWKELEKTMDDVVEKSEVNETIRDTVYEAVDKVLEENSEVLGGLKREDIQKELQTLTSGKLFFTFVGASLGLLLLLCLLNFYNVPAGLTWAALPTIFAGLIMSVPIVLLSGSADAVIQAVPDLASVVGVLASFVNVFAVIHYGLLGIGVALLVISIAWRILRVFVRKRRA